MQDALIFLVKTLSDLYILTFLLRLVLQWLRADFYNPLSQFILQITNPLVLPLRRIVPSIGGLDTATVLVLIALQSLASALLLLLRGASLPPLGFARLVAISLISLLLWTYLILIIVYAVLSWTGPRYGNPLVSVLRQLVEPVLRPIRRFVPPIGGLDIAPLLALIAIQALLIAIR